MYMVGSQAEACLAASERALRLAQEVGPVEEVARVLQFRGHARLWLGEVDEGLADIREALRLSLELGLQETPRAYVNLAGLVSEQDGPAAGLKTYREGIEFGARRGELGLSAWAKGETVWPLFDLGEWDELLQVSSEVIEGSREALIAALVAPYRAMVLVRRGRVDEAADLISEFMPLARKATGPQVLVPSLVVSALMANAHGQREAALDAALEALSLVDRPGHRWWLSQEIVEVLLSVEDAERARNVLQWPEEGTTRNRLARLSVQSMVAEADGRLDQSVALYREAAEKWKEFGFVLARGQALFGAGRSRIGLSRPAEAMADLRGAREVFAKLQAAPLLAETDDWLERATALTS
jgi:tetratricopeptide (TPR) repeat protein